MKQPKIRLNGFQGEWKTGIIENTASLKFCNSFDFHREFCHIYPCYGGNGIREYVDIYGSTTTNTSFPLLSLRLLHIRNLCLFIHSQMAMDVQLALYSILLLSEENIQQHLFQQFCDTNMFNHLKCRIKIRRFLQISLQNESQRHRWICSDY